jgi:iron complex outermembrane receptor protein
VPSYTTLDWQGRYVVNDALVIRGGIKNLLDRDPPLSLRNSSGHQVGYDPRYADQIGRQAYLTANYKF